MATPESPYGPSNAENVAGSKPVRLPHLLAAKGKGTKLTMITAYDGLTAAIFDAAGMDMSLDRQRHARPRFHPARLP